MATMATAQEQNLEKLLHNGNNKLSARMFTEVANVNPEKSFILSAYSIMTPLAQIGLASIDDAHNELLDAIGMPNDNTTKEVFSLANTKLRSVKAITLKTANKIYIAQKYVLNNKFATETRNVFGSEVQNINFLDKDNAAKEVNTWVAKQTNDRIKNLVDPNILTEYTRALLVNAIYFKGLWETQFEKSLTHDRQFHINKTKTTTVHMMHIEGNFEYMESHMLKSQLHGSWTRRDCSDPASMIHVTGSKYRQINKQITVVIKIPYKGGESSLIIVLPREIEGIKQVKKTMSDPNVLDDALKSIHSSQVNLYIPRFKIETTTDLKTILTKMNIKKMFDASTAKIDKLLEDVKDLYIDTATQKAFIEVNEEGAEAAAANVFSVSYPDSIGLEPVVINFIADHPFLFFLRHEDNTLFSGIYYANEDEK